MYNQFYALGFFLFTWSGEVSKMNYGDAIEWYLYFYKKRISVVNS